MVRKKVLIVEDDRAIRERIVDALAFHGYVALQAARGEVAIDKALHGGCDLVILDPVLPGTDGTTVLREVRRARPTLPIIILTARGEDGERVRGLPGGPDHYVVKPFGIHELLARVDAMLRRSPERPSDVRRLMLPGGFVDLETREVCMDGDPPVDLSERETDLLHYLAVNASRIVSRDELLSRVWGVSPKAIETRTVDMHVARLRDKLHDEPGAPRLVLTVRGKGYRWNGPR